MKLHRYYSLEEMEIGHSSLKVVDRRLSKRLISRKKIKFVIGKPNYIGLTFNISEGGIGFIANKPLMPGTQIIADLFLGEETLRILGVIQWSVLCLDGYRSRMGVKITSRPEKIRALLVSRTRV